MLAAALGRGVEATQRRELEPVLVPPLLGGEAPQADAGVAREGVEGGERGVDREVHPGLAVGGHQVHRLRGVDHGEQARGHGEHLEVAHDRVRLGRHGLVEHLDLPG